MVCQCRFRSWPNTSRRAVPDVPGVAVDLLVGLLVQGEAAGAEGLVRGLLRQGAPRTAVIAELLGPALANVGQQWQHGSISVAVEHRASSIAEAILSTVVTEGARNGHGRRVWLTGVEGEWHTLPTRLVAGVWRCLGWDVVALTPSLPAPELRLLAAADDTSLAGVSCSLAANLVPAWQAISVLRESRFRVIVGGRGFDALPEVSGVFGADAHFRDPVSASETLRDWSALQPPGPREPLLLGTWQDLRATWQALPRLVEDAVWVAQEIGGVDLAVDVLREDLTLIARTGVAAALAGHAGVLTEHMRWYGTTLEASEVSPETPRALLAALERVLPASSPVRDVLGGP